MQGDDAQMLLWARQALGVPEAREEWIVKTPWSAVVALHTTDTVYYLKRTAPDLFIEAAVIDTCRKLCGINDIPEIIAQNDALHCFLMNSCGDASLRTLSRDCFQMDLFLQALAQYRAFQQATAPHVSAFLDRGVPDWRLAQFPALYEALISDDAFLAAQKLNAEQIRQLRQGVPKLPAICAELAGFGIPECLNHSDLNDNNILVTEATGAVSIIDLGETAVDHPFL